MLAEYPGATIERTETDAGGVYESHIVTADGERLTVLVDEDFAVTGTETGGRGGRGPGGGDCPEDDAAAGTTEEPATPDPGTSRARPPRRRAALTAPPADDRRSGPARRRTRGTGRRRRDCGTWQRTRSRERPCRRPTA